MNTKIDRDDVASCIEVAYDKLSLEDAIPTLFFDSKQATREFENKVHLFNNYIHFLAWLEVRARKCISFSKKHEEVR